MQWIFTLIWNWFWCQLRWMLNCFCKFFILKISWNYKNRTSISQIFVWYGCRLTFLSFSHFFFRNYFENCCHVKVPGRLFPIQEYYLEDILINVNNSSSENHKNKTRVDESETVMIRKNPQNPQNSLFSALGVTK